MSLTSISFSTQWKKENILIDVKGSFLLIFFIKMFFKNWRQRKIKPYESKVRVEFGKPLEKIEIIKTKLFSYQRTISHDIVLTRVVQLNFFRAFIRSGYKFIFNRSTVIGIPELFMAIIRKTIIEPIEFISIKKGFLLIHASVFKHYNKTFVVVAASKAGKSTIVSKLSCLKNIEILSDNYCLIKGNKIKTIEEPFRSGDPKRSQVTFYGRTITGRPNLFEGEVDFIIYLNRGDENSLKKITCLQMQNIIREINNLEKEGVGHLSPLDPIKIDEQKVELCNELKYYSLNIAEGIENVEVAINQLINLK